MARKYLERSTSARDLEDDLEHSASITKIDADEATAVKDRSIIFTKHERPLTTTEATQVVAKELTSTVQDTGQYIQDVRTHIDRQMSTISRIKAQKEEFDRELEMLQFGNQQPKIDSPIDEMKKIRSELSQKKEIEEANLIRLNNHARITKKQVDHYQVLIDQVDAKLKNYIKH